MFLQHKIPFFLFSLSRLFFFPAYLGKFLTPFTLSASVYFSEFGSFFFLFFCPPPFFPIFSSRGNEPPLPFLSRFFFGIFPDRKIFFHLDSFFAVFIFHQQPRKFFSFFFFWQGAWGGNRPAFISSFRFPSILAKKKKKSLFFFFVINVFLRRPPLFFYPLWPCPALCLPSSMKYNFPPGIFFPGKKQGVSIQNLKIQCVHYFLKYPRSAGYNIVSRKKKKKNQNFFLWTYHSEIVFFFSRKGFFFFPNSFTTELKADGFWLLCFELGITAYLGGREKSFFLHFFFKKKKVFFFQKDLYAASLVCSFWWK